MIQNSPQAQAGATPRLAVINSMAGFGRSSMTVALPVISILGVQACPLPTSVLSNHLGFPSCYFQDFTPHMEQYLAAWEQLDIVFDGLYCGFLGSQSQIDIVKGILQSPLMAKRHARPIFLLDPVMGDHGRAYSTITPAHCHQMKELAGLADILTPNITEACLLTGTPYREGRFTDSELATICEKLAALTDRANRPSDKRIVITGMEAPDAFINFIWENGSYSTYGTCKTGAPHPGTGDLFASILAAEAVKQAPFVPSVKKAADFVALCIRDSTAAGLPNAEGVLFEKNLSGLLSL